MQKRTVIDQIEITRDGTINVRMAKEIVDDDGTVISSGWHRTTLPPGTDVDAQFAAVNAHLSNGLKAAPVAVEDIQRLKTVVPVVQTAAVRAAHAAKIAAARPKPEPR